MGETKGPYSAEFPAGSKVRIADRPFLEHFLSNWKLHNKLTTDQLEFADKITEVKSVGFYHGADELYMLKGVPGIWHEQCLRPLEKLAKNEDSF